MTNIFQRNTLSSFSVTTVLMLLKLCSIPLQFQAQKVEGNFENYKGQIVYLYAHKGIGAYLIDSCITDSLGSFELNFSAKDWGFGYLQHSGFKKEHMLLAEDTFVNLSNSQDNISYSKGNLNILLRATIEKKHEILKIQSQLLKIENLYVNNNAFLKSRRTIHYLKNEIKYLHYLNDHVLVDIPRFSISYQYINLYFLLWDLSNFNQPEKLNFDALIKRYRDIDFGNDLVSRSGLLREVLESQFWFIESFTEDSLQMNLEMIKSIDKIISDIEGNEVLLNEISSYLLTYFELKSLTQVSEYLSLLLLNKSGCNIEPQLTKQLEFYRAMQLGNIASNINLSFQSYLAGRRQSQFESIDSFQTEFTLVFFGSSWCPKCNEELPKIIGKYSEWRNKGMEVIFISLDSESADFEKNLKSIPFFSYCDYKSWESEVVKAYFVFGTPSYFILNKERKIILKPISAEQVDSWAKTYLPISTQQQYPVEKLRN
jgi:thiol-disulfide isomerase/thioredoxin